MMAAFGMLVAVLQLIVVWKELGVVADSHLHGFQMME